MVIWKKMNTKRNSEKLGELVIKTNKDYSKLLFDQRTSGKIIIRESRIWRRFMRLRNRTEENLPVNKMSYCLLILNQNYDFLVRFKKSIKYIVTIRINFKNKKPET